MVCTRVWPIDQIDFERNYSTINRCIHEKPPAFHEDISYALDRIVTFTKLKLGENTDYENKIDQPLFRLSINSFLFNDIMHSNARPNK